MKKRILALALGVMFGFAGVAFAGCDEKPQTHTILAQSYNLEGGGAVTGYGNYATNALVSLVATPNADHQFLAWIKDNKVVSYDAQYNFLASKTTAGTYVALFDCPNFQFARLGTVDYQISALDVPNYNVSLQKWQLSFGQIQGLYQPLATLGSMALESGTPTALNNALVTHEDVVLFAQEKYTFVLNMTFEYSPHETGTNIVENVSTMFEIDLANLSSANAVKTGNQTTYENTKYSLSLEQNGNAFSLLIDFHNLNTPSKWNTKNQSSQQSIWFTLNYSVPFTNA